MCRRTDRAARWRETAHRSQRPTSRRTARSGLPPHKPCRLSHAPSWQQNWPLRDGRARRGVRFANAQDPPGQARRVLDELQRQLSIVGVVADVHPDVAPAERRHRLLPHIALVIRVVARVIDVWDGEEDRRVKAMMPPDKALAAERIAVEPCLRVGSHIRQALDAPRRGDWAAEARVALEVPYRGGRSTSELRSALELPHRGGWSAAGVPGIAMVPIVVIVSGPSWGRR